MGRFLGASCPPMCVLPASRDLAGLRRASREPRPEWAGGIFDKPTFIFVGRLEASKGLDRLLGAFSAACARGTDAHLIICGEGKLRVTLEELAFQFGIGQRVFFVGRQENPYPLMASSRALVLTSHYEGIPGVALEALALGVPVIAFNCSPGLGELLEDGKSGVLIDDGDEIAFALSLRRFVDNPTWAEAKVRRGLRRADEFDSKPAAEILTTLYRSFGRRGTALRSQEIDGSRFARR